MWGLLDTRFSFVTSNSSCLSQVSLRSLIGEILSFLLAHTMSGHRASVVVALRIYVRETPTTRLVTLVTLGSPFGTAFLIQLVSLAGTGLSERPTSLVYPTIFRGRS